MPYVETTEQNRVLTITLNRPDKYNSFTESMAVELQEALEDATPERIRSVLLRANGKAFCGGQDLSEISHRLKEKEYDAGDTVRTSYNPVIRAIRRLEKPVVCAVQGTAAGAGANIAFACDLVVASTDAVFLLAFGKLGLIPDSGGTFFLPRLAGFARTNALYLMDEKLTAGKAVEWGLIYKTVAPDALTTQAADIAEKLASLPTKGVALYKKAINQTYTRNLDQQLDLEADLQGEAGKTGDFREGLAAFMEKRNPRFTGL